MMLGLLDVGIGEIMEWASIDADFEDSINHIEDDKSQIYNEIMAIASQKKFKIGRIFVSPCKRYQFKEIKKRNSAYAN